MTNEEFLKNIDLNLEIILRPLDGEDPCGEYLKYTDTYDKITEALREDNPKLAMGIWTKPLKRADWNKAKILCQSVLESSSKDIQIAVWLMLALLKLHGMQGFCAGLQIILELCKKFWKSINPKITDDDFDTRLSSFYWIDEKLIYHLKMIPITSHPIEGSTYTYESWERDNIHLKQKDINFNPVEKYLEFVEESEEVFHRNLEMFINDSLSIISELKSLLISANLIEFPHFVNLIKTLDDIKSLNNFALLEFDKKNKITSEQEIIEELPVENENHVIPINESTGKISTTDQAYKLLFNAADFLIKNHPDHPSGQMAMQAYEFRNKSLKSSLAFNIKDEEILKKVFKILSI